MIKTNIIWETEFNEVEVKKIIKQVSKKINKVEKIKGCHLLSIIIVDEKRIWDINREYRHIDNPTDVISFALIDSEVDHKLPKEMGDIFICKERVLSQANDYGHSVTREFAFLVTHGIYHLLGYDHQTKDEEEEMFTKQEEILKILGIER